MFKNKNGFSLVEVMIAIGLLGAGAVFFMKFQQKQMKSQKTVMNTAAITEYMASIKGYMTKPGVCQNSFKDIQLHEEEELEGIKRSDGKLKFKVGDRLTGSTFVLKEMRFGDIFIEEKAEGDTYARAEAMLVLTFEKTKQGTSYGNKVMRKSFEIDVQVDDSDNIYDCAPLGHLSIPNSGTSGSNSALTTNNELDKAFNDSVQEAMKISGKEIDQEKINNAAKNNPAFKGALDSINQLKELNKKMEEALNEP
jgi:prepilin-type N-terminal cleavage/methylation domain-containing protein